MVSPRRRLDRARASGLLASPRWSSRPQLAGLVRADQVIAGVRRLGKCGGRELGFASDIELMFVYGGKGKTSGVSTSSTTTEITDTGDYFEKLVRSIMSTIHARQEGIFQIDLQLRPYGKAGNMAVALEAFRRWRFKPGRDDSGSAVRVIVQQPIRFQLR